MSEWEETQVGEVAAVSRTRVEPADLGDQLVCHYSIPAYDETRHPVVEPASGIRSAKFAVERDSVLVSMLNPRIPRVWKVAGARDAVCSTEFAVLVPRDDAALTLEYLYLVCQGEEFATTLEARAKGTTGSRTRSRAEDALRFRFALPPLVEQRRIVTVMSAVDAQIEALEVEAKALGTVYENGLGMLWLDESGDAAAVRSLQEVMVLDLQRVKVESNSNYQVAGVLNAGQGLIDRGNVRGSDTDYANFNRLSTDQVVMRKLTAWEGPIAVVPPTFDGFVASPEFPTFGLSAEVSSRYFEHVCRSPRLWGAMRARVTGTVQRRKRLNPDQLLDVSLPIPPRRRQEVVANALSGVHSQRSMVVIELSALRIARSDLLAALLSREITVDEAVDRFAAKAA